MLQRRFQVLCLTNMFRARQWSLVPTRRQLTHTVFWWYLTGCSITCSKEMNPTYRPPPHTVWLTSTVCSLSSPPLSISREIVVMYVTQSVQQSALMRNYKHADVKTNSILPLLLHLIPYGKLKLATCFSKTNNCAK